MTQLVSTRSVNPTQSSSQYHIRKMVNVLLRQGQIEPLQVRALDDDKYITFDEDAHGNDIIHAATFLGWPTLLITVVKKYIS